MDTRKIGSTDVSITPLCFGTSALGNMPGTYGYEVDEERALNTVRAIFDGPANSLDTANFYGFGRSEDRIGRVIAERGGLPEGFVLATKLDREVEHDRFDGDRARRSLEESLTRLNLDKVQMLHLHDPEYARDMTEVTGKGGALEVLFAMKEEGLAESVGLAMGRIDLQMSLLRDWPFDVLINHNRLTLLNRSANEMFDYAHQNGIAVLNAAPYAGGVLAKGAAEMPRVTYQEASEQQLEPVHQIEAICAEYGVPTGAVALAFSMRDPRVTSTIVGVSKPERVAETLALAATKIPDEVWTALEAVPFSATDPEADRDYTPE